MRGLQRMFLTLSDAELHFNLDDAVIQIDKLAREIVHRSLNAGDAPAKIGAQILNAGADSLETPVIEVQAEGEGQHRQSDGNEQLDATHNTILLLPLRGSTAAQQSDAPKWITLFAPLHS